jgi:hypothetical protein
MLSGLMHGILSLRAGGKVIVKFDGKTSAAESPHSQLRLMKGLIDRWLE